MKYTYKFLNTWQYREMYYIYLLKRLRDGFFQKNGFIVLPNSKLKSSSEVIFPQNNSTTLDKLTGFILSSKSKDIPFKLSALKYSKVKPIKEILFPHNHEVRDLEKLLDAKKNEVEKALDFLIPDKSKAKKVIFNIVPVDFGTICTFGYKEEKASISLYMTFRIDLDISYFLEALMSSIVVRNLNNKTNNHATEDDSIYWQKREFLTDYLVHHTIVSKIVPNIKIHEETLVGINRARQLGEAVKESREYLAKLGLSSDVLEMKIVGGMLIVNDAVLYLTKSEEKIVKLLISKKGEICSFDDLAKVLWENDADKFSAYALSRILSDIRSKIKSAGVLNDGIYTARGRGVLLNV